MADDRQNRSDKRMTCPVCKGYKKIIAGVPTVDGVEMVGGKCSACNGVGEVCVCPVCNGEAQEESCRSCGGKGWVRIDKWKETVDKGHKKIVEEIKEEKASEEKMQEGALTAVAKAYQDGMNEVARQWGQACSKMVASGVDAGTYARIVGGLTVGYMNDLAKTLGVDRATMQAMMFNGMLAFLERSSDYEVAAIVASQSKELLATMKLGRVAREKGRMN